MLVRANQRRGALVVGSTGLIGRALMQSLPAVYRPVLGTVRGTPGTGQFHLDLASPDFVGMLAQDGFSSAASVVQSAFLCSAVTRFADCAKNPEASYRVNVTHTLELADFLLERGAAVIQLSSNAVFDGAIAGCAEHAEPNPVTVYGKQKAAAEIGLQKLMAQSNGCERNAKIIRLTKVLSAGLPLVSGWIRNLRAGQCISAFKDLIFAPVSLRYVTDALAGLAVAGKPGIYHLSGSKDISYFEFALLLARHLGVDSGLVSADRAAEQPGLTELPKHSAMAMDITRRETGVVPQTPEEVVKDIIEENYAC